MLKTSRIMNKSIKLILIFVGIVLTAYGIYKIITPEAAVDIGIAEFESQNNKDGYITIGFGIVALITGFFVKKK